MAEKEPIAILPSEIAQHQATLAWKQISSARTPQAIEVLQKRRKSEIYRLLGGIASGESIIAKRCVTKTGKFEQVIYEDILPYLPISQLQYYGSIQENDSYMWLFLADAGKSSFSPTNASHRILAAHWLSALHRFARQIGAAQKLPRRDPTYYLQLMREGRENIVRNLENPTLTPEYVGILKSVLVQVEILDAHWGNLASICQDFPPTVVHADFQPKNIRVKPGAGRDELYVMDWEMTGWGLPVVDLAPSHGMSSSAEIDLSAYLDNARDVWPNLDMPTLRFVLHIGCIYRRLAAIYWSSLQMSLHWVEGPIRDMDIFHKELSHAMQAVFGTESVND